jgi:hypothetical protein
MAVLSSLFNIGTQYPSAPPQGTTVTSQKLAEEISPFYKDLLAKSQALYNQQTEEGYTPYTAPTMAQFSPEQQQSFAGIQGLVGSQKPAYDEGMALTRGTTRRFTPQTAQALMNPYQQAVTDIEKRNIQENYESKVLPELRAQAAQIQPFGGSRQAILEGMASDANQRLLADVQAKGSLTAYNDAQRLFADQIKREGAAASQLPTLASAAYKTQAGELGALQAVGEEKQKQTQSALDEAYRTYLEEKRFPETSMGQYQATVQGFPALRQEITRSAPPPQPSMANQLIGGLGTLGSLYGAYGGFSSGGFGSALPGYGPVNQKEGSGATTILPRQNPGMANPNDPRYDMSFEDPNMIGEVEQNRLMESQRLQELELMSDPSVLENQYRAAMIIVNGGTPEEVMRSQQIMRGATELGVDMQSLIDEVRTSNREEAAIDRQEFMQGIGDKVGGGLQSLQEVLGARQGRAEGGPVLNRFLGGGVSSSVATPDPNVSQEEAIANLRNMGLGFGGIIGSGMANAFQQKLLVPEQPTPVAVETTQPNTQLLPADTTNRVDPRRQPAYTGVIGTGGLVDITDDGLQVFQKTQQGILNRSLYGGVLEAGNPALASTPVEETATGENIIGTPDGTGITLPGFPSPDSPSEPYIPPSGLVVQTGQDKYGNVVGDMTGTKDYFDLNFAARDAGQDTFMYGEKLMQVDPGYLRGGGINPFISNRLPAGLQQEVIDRPDLFRNINNLNTITKIQGDPTDPGFYSEAPYLPTQDFSRDISGQYNSYYAANQAAKEAGSPTFMWGDKLAKTDPGLLPDYNYSKEGPKPFISNAVPEKYISAGVNLPPGWANMSANQLAKYQPGYKDPNAAMMYGPAKHGGQVSQVIKRKGGGLVDLPVVKRQQNAGVLSPADQALLNTFNNSNDAAQRAEIRNKLQGKIDLGYNLRDRGSIFTGINNTMNSIFDTVTKLEIPDNISAEVRRILFEENYDVNNLGDMENNLKKIINADTSPSLGYVDSISGNNQQQAIEDQDTPPSQLYERGKQLVDIGVDTAISGGKFLASLLTSSKDNIKNKEGEEDKSDNKIITENKEEIVKPQLEANNTALSLLDEFNLINPARDSSLLGFENKLNTALTKSRNKNAAVVKAIKDQDKRIKDRIAQAPEAIRMEIFARMAQGFASMATSASPPVQAFLEQVPSFVEDTTAMGRAQRDRVDNLEDLAVESARAEAALADSEFTQATSMAAFGLDKEAISQKREAAFAELAAKKYGLDAYSDASKYIDDFVGFQKNTVYGNARRGLIEFVLQNGPAALKEDVVQTYLNQNDQQDVTEKKSILDKIRGLIK